MLYEWIGLQFGVEVEGSEPSHRFTPLKQIGLPNVTVDEDVKKLR